MRTDVPNHCYLLAGTHFLASLAPSALTTDRPEKPRSQHQFFPPRGARSGHLGLLVRGIQGSANSHGAIGIPPGDVPMSPFQNTAKTQQNSTVLTGGRTKLCSRAGCYTTSARCAVVAVHAPLVGAPWRLLWLLNVAKTSGKPTNPPRPP